MDFIKFVKSIVSAAKISEVKGSAAHAPAKFGSIFEADNVVKDVASSVRCGAVSSNEVAAAAAAYCGNEHDRGLLAKVRFVGGGSELISLSTVADQSPAGILNALTAPVTEDREAQRELVKCMPSAANGWVPAGEWRLRG